MYDIFSFVTGYRGLDWMDFEWPLPRGTMLRNLPTTVGFISRFLQEVQHSFRQILALADFEGNCTLVVALTAAILLPSFGSTLLNMGSKQEHGCTFHLFQN